MPRYEYKVVPAPRKGQKSKGVRSSEARFALALEAVMNEMCAEGWEYQRAETLPCEERQGLTGRTTTFHNILVFRRELVAEETTPEIAADESAVPGDGGEAEAGEALRPDAPSEAKEAVLPRLGGATRAVTDAEEASDRG